MTSGTARGAQNPGADENLCRITCSSDCGNHLAGIAAAGAGIASSQLGPAETQDLHRGKAALFASPSSVARVGGDMVGEVALDPAVDAIDGDPNTALMIVRTAPRKNCSTEVARELQDGAVERPAAGGLGTLVAGGSYRRHGHMDTLPVFPDRKGRRQMGGGRLDHQADFLYGQQ